MGDLEYPGINDVDPNDHNDSDADYNNNDDDSDDGDDDDVDGEKGNNKEAILSSPFTRLSNSVINKIILPSRIFGQRTRPGDRRRRRRRRRKNRKGSSKGWLGRIRQKF